MRGDKIEQHAGPHEFSTIGRTHLCLHDDSAMEAQGGARGIARRIYALLMPVQQHPPLQMTELAIQKIGRARLPT